MAAISQSDKNEILRLVGGIVLTSQDVERYLKHVLPYIGNGELSVSSQIARHEKLKKRMLGLLVGELVDSSTSDSLDFSQHMARIVHDRNQVVHHFNETYGQQLSTGSADEVKASLQSVLANLTNLKSVTEQMMAIVLEGLRDITFANTPEQTQMADLCASFRQQIAS
ncbi:hypothetical protein [Novilysobacter avium]|uniref:Uncharacterized protein n=1 Tax=Novilysobacter avium TaxID=2781023 RepID=A0A7S6UKN1_9GAMM|nr:hypothetical protein [Lysobacter avium]QOW22030.1 hypothetical protein INQ42_12655 [Lysobacter avium]